MTAASSEWPLGDTTSREGLACPKAMSVNELRTQLAKGGGPLVVASAVVRQARLVALAVVAFLAGRALPARAEPSRVANVGSTAPMSLGCKTVASSSVTRGAVNPRPPPFDRA